MLNMNIKILSDHSDYTDSDYLTSVQHINYQLNISLVTFSDAGEAYLLSKVTQMKNHCSPDSDQGGEGNTIIREEKTSGSGQSGGPILVNDRVATNRRDAQPSNQNVTVSYQPALTFPAVQLFYLLPATLPGDPSALAPACSSLGQPLFLPVMINGTAEPARFGIWNLKEGHQGGGRSQHPEKEVLHIQELPSGRRFFRPWESGDSRADLPASGSRD